jgi:hypothetical protein
MQKIPVKRGYIFTCLHGVTSQKKIGPMLNPRINAQKCDSDEYVLKFTVLVSVGIATGYGLDVRGSIPGSGNICLFSTASSPALRRTQPPIEWYGGCFPGGKATGA